VVTTPARRDLVRWMQSRGLTERRGLQMVRMSASSLRYQPRPDRNHTLRARIVALAQRHRRYGAAMIYLKLRQGGELVNHKRVERLYAPEKLQENGAGARRSRWPSVSPWCVPDLPTRYGQWTSCLIASPQAAPSSAL
jgi:hypothetical protein